MYTSQKFEIFDFHISVYFCRVFFLGFFFYCIILFFFFLVVSVCFLFILLGYIILFLFLLYYILFILLLRVLFYIYFIFRGFLFCFLVWTHGHMDTLVYFGHMDTWTHQIMGYESCIWHDVEMGFVSLCHFFWKCLLLPVQRVEMSSFRHIGEMCQNVSYVSSVENGSFRVFLCVWWFFVCLAMVLWCFWVFWVLCLFFLFCFITLLYGFYYFL